MAASPEVMSALMGGAGPQDPMSMPGPSAAGMLSPSEPGGMIEAGKAQVMVAMKILENAIPVFGATSEQGSAVLKAIQNLAKTFGPQADSAEKLLPAEMMEVYQGLAGPGAPPPGLPPPMAMGPGGAPPPGGPPLPPGGAPPPGMPM